MCRSFFPAGFESNVLIRFDIDRFINLYKPHWA
jgi:hypothetical protein